MFWGAASLKEGYKWEDVSANDNKNKNKHYDIEATKDGKTVCVEVKGTRSLVMNEIFMSANEERFHFKKEQGKTALALVTGIELKKGPEGKPEGCGGSLEWLYPWQSTEWERKPYTFKVIRPKNASQE